MADLKVARDTFQLAERFTISRGSRTEAKVITVTITDGGYSGVGECVPYARYDETLESVESTIQALQSDLRNTLTSAYTLSLDEPEHMKIKAASNATRPLLKIKLGGGESDIARLQAVREGAPESTIIVDANEGWDRAQYESLAPVLLELGVAMVEQPFAAGDDAVLADMEAGKYDMVNIKLDKTGGLTEALLLEKSAREAGFEIMVGCMIGSSLAMAPAVLVAQQARFVDLDGPLLLAEDRSVPLNFEGSVLHPPLPELWG